MKKIYLLYLGYLFLICYLLINTPLISDDFSLMIKEKGVNLFVPQGWFIVAPLEHYFFRVWYYFFSLENLYFVNFLKIVYTFLSFYLIGKFFAIFLDRQEALLVSFLFLFFPSHDSTVYWFLGIYGPLTIAFYMYAYYLAHHNKLVWAFIVALIASFTTYASVHISILFVTLFVLRKEFKKAFVMLVPVIIFSFYYIFISRVLALTKSEIPEGVILFFIIKQFILQIFTFIDAVVGPSMWLKIYYSFFQLSLASIVIGILCVIIFYRKYKQVNRSYNPRLVISFLILMLFSFFIFAITEWHSQINFNLGNRVTIFGSLLLAYLIVLIPFSKRIKTFMFAIFIFVILGISDHWKNWNMQQQEVIANIKNNPQLNAYQEDKIIYVSGNQYSKYGPISHIEFLSEDWVPNCILKIALEKDISAASLNKRHKYIDGYLVDTKYNKKRKVDDYIYVYDSKKNELLKLDADEINSYINSLPSDNRHWVQMLDIKFIKNIAIRLMPRLKYILK